MNTRKSLLFLSFALIFLCLAADSLALEAGDPLPEVVLRSLSGEYTSVSFFKGRIIIINFWATWCPPCKKEIAVLNDIARAYRKDVAVFGLSNEDPITIRNFTRLQPVEYPVLLDGESNIHKRFGVLQIPATFIVDRAGVVRKKHSGPLDFTEIRKTIESLR